MDKKTYAIGILFLSALILFVAQLVITPAPMAQAAEAVRDRDYSLVTARSTAGGEALYIADSRTGVLAVFTWDPARRSVVVRDARMISESFGP